MLTKPDLNKPVFKMKEFAEEKHMVEEDVCVFCKTHIKEDDFKDELSKREYSISGMCQTCQDRLFGV